MIKMSINNSLESSFDDALFASEIIPEKIVKPRREANNHYVEEYLKTFKSDNYLINLKRRAIRGDLRSCRFRSIAWRIFLDCIPEKSDEWIAASQANRQEYQAIWDKYDTNPYQHGNHNFEENNPLSQEESSLWHKYFQDNELKSTITQDVVRTFPEIDFFQSQSMQDMLCNILFHFARENPKISYKQGMHELLAPILFIVNSDQQALLHAKELNLLTSQDEQICKEIEELLNPTYLEHDTYFMFRQVMETVEPWYSHEMISFKMDSINFEPFSTSLEPSSCSVLGIKLRRWLRLLFGREFSLQDLLVMWDAIFSDGISFSLCDYIFASMLIVIRDLLLSSNYSQCMNHLMRYPSVPDTQYILDLALHLRDPINHPEPHGYSLNVLPAEVSPSPIHVVLPEVAEQRAVSSTSYSSRESAAAALRSYDLNHFKKSNRPKSLPLPPSSLTVHPGGGVGASSSGHHQQKQNGVAVSSPNHPLAPGAGQSGVSGTSSNTSSSTSPISSASNMVTKKGAQEMKPIAKSLTLNGKEFDYCCELLTTQIDVLQKNLAEEELKSNDVIFLAIAKLKIARDLLKGTLKLNEFD